MLSTVLELVGFVLVVVCVGCLAGWLWAGLLVGAVFMYAGYAMGDVE